MKVYIAGKITGAPDYRIKFSKAEKFLKDNGMLTMNPAVLPDGFEQSEYLQICFAMINVCDAVYFLNNWRDSPGATKEFEYALAKGKILLYEGKDIC